MTPEEQGTTDAAKDKAQEVAGQAQEQAQQLAGQARSQVTDQVDQRTTQAGEQVSGTVEDLKGISSQLRDQGNDNAAKLADQVAKHGERVGNYLQESDGQKILSDAEDFGRRQPLVVLAGGAVLGLAAARFLKASSSRRYSESNSGSSSAYTGTSPTGSPRPTQTQTAAPAYAGSAADQSPTPARDLASAGTATGTPAS